jgi:hypothetical protein
VVRGRGDEQRGCGRHAAHLGRRSGVSGQGHPVPDTALST